MKKTLALLVVLSLFSLTFAAIAGCTESPSDPTPSVPDDNPEIPANAINAVDEWGISAAHGAGMANGLALYQRMTLLPNGATVYFPAGVYELDLPLLITGKKNIRIVGDHVTFLNTRAINTAATQPPSDDPSVPSSMQASTATSGMVWIEGSQNITIEGITFCYETPTSLSGQVVNLTSSYADIRITDNAPITGNEHVMAINTFTEEGIPNRVLEQYAASNFPVEKLNETTLRVRGINASRLANGTRVCLRMSLSSNYVFTVFNSSDLVFRDLVLQNSFNGGFLIEHRTVNATFERVSVKPGNENSLFSLNADALHIAGLGGTLTVTDCHFERGGDDFINVHGVAAKPTSVSGNTLAFTLPWGADSRWVAKGDVIEFYSPADFTCIGSATVTRVSGANLTFDSLPSGVTTSTVLSNKTLHPSVRISGTYALYNRARAFLLQTDDITIDNCHFVGTSLAAVLIAPDIDTWGEMAPAENVTIQNSTFRDCGAEALGVIQFATDHDNLTAATTTPIHENIVIRNNTFASVVPALYAISCRQISFVDNVITEVAVSQALSFFSSVGVTYDEAVSDRAYTYRSTDITVVP